MAWFFAPLVFFLFVGVVRFKMTVGAAELDIVDSSRFGDVLWMEGWTFWSKTLCRRHVMSFNDYYHYCLLLLSGDVALNPGPLSFRVLCVIFL